MKLRCLVLPLSLPQLFVLFVLTKVQAFSVLQLVMPYMSNGIIATT
jgi:hypothetical protein